MSLNTGKLIKKIFFILFALSVCKAFVYAQTDVYLSLSATGKRSDIAVESFSSGDKSAETVKITRLLQDIVENDLILSRYFNIIKGDSEERLSLEERFSFWDKKGAMTLLTVSVKLNGNEVTLDAALYDVQSGGVIWQQPYKGDAVDYRLLAHRVSDEIVRRLTGESGISGSKIAFINDGTKFKELYIIDYDGNNLRRLTSDKKLNIIPKWSPDGEQIIYTGYFYNNPDLYSLNLAKNRRTIISKYQGLNAVGAFSPDSERIVLTLSRGRYPNLFLINKSGAILRRMTDGSNIDTSPSFAPNGREIVFISDRPGFPQLYIMNVDGGNVRRLTTEGPCDSPAWSPRGDKIVFTMRQLKGNYDLYVYDLLTSKVTKITNNQRNNKNPTWSPDGRFVVFSSTRSGRDEIYIMAIDGSGTRKLAEIPGRSYTPAWSPNLNK